MDKNIFSKSDTTLYKGIGILLIVIHNYLHWQPGFGIENEDTFKINNVKTFLNHLYPFQWTDTFSAIFGYLGHYGVQLFIFFSAYGLAVQFLNADKPHNYFSYLYKRLKKLYFLLFFGIILFLIFYFLMHGKFYGITRTIQNTILLSTSISNFSHETLYSMFTGPFWFFGLMVQMYIIYPILWKIVNRYNILTTSIGTLILIYGLYYMDLKTNFSLFGTVFGHLPEIILGIYFAINGKTKPSLYILITSIVLFILSQINLYFFPLGFISITLILLFLIELLKNNIQSFWKSILIYFGEISMTLFIINGFFRNYHLFKISDSTLRGERIFLYLTLLIIISHFTHKLYNSISKKIKI